MRSIILMTCFPNNRPQILDQSLTEIYNLYIGIEIYIDLGFRPVQKEKRKAKLIMLINVCQDPNVDETVDRKGQLLKQKIDI